MATKKRARQKAAPLDVLDLAVSEQRKRFSQIVAENTTDFERYTEASEISVYASQGKDTPIRIGDSRFFLRQPDNWNYAHNYFILRPDGLIYADQGDATLLNKDSVRKLNRETPTAVVIPSEKRLGDNKNNKHMLLLNGDEDFNEATADLGGYDYPTVSFECVNRFFEFKNNRANSAITQLARLFSNGTLLVVDYDPDVRRPLSQSEKEQLKNFNRNKNAAEAKSKSGQPPRPPEAGFTLIHGGGQSHWHRSATVILRDTREGGRTMLIGQDEGTYFGVELPKHAMTVKDAFEVLTPPEARRNSEVKRQGEWFLVPVAASQVPPLEQCLVTSDDSLALPVDTPDSNKHLVWSQDIRVSRDGTVYAENVTVHHSANDHEDVLAGGWVKFLRNTAIRSFSVAGVD